MKSLLGQASPARGRVRGCRAGGATELDPLGALWGHRCCCLRGEGSTKSQAALPGRQLPSANSPKDHTHEWCSGAGCPRRLFYNPLLISRRWHASDPCVHFARRPSLTAQSPFWRCLSRAGRLGSRRHPTPQGGERDTDPRPPLRDPSEWHRAPGCPWGGPTATP